MGVTDIPAVDATSSTTDEVDGIFFELRGKKVLLLFLPLRLHSAGDPFREIKAGLVVKKKKPRITWGR